MLPSIYSQLGPEHLKNIVDQFYDFVQQDDRINHLFKTDIELVKEKQLMFLTQFFGGPQLYSQEFGHPRIRYAQRACK